MTGFDELYVIVTDLIPVQCEKELLSNDIIPLGIDKLVKPVQLENASAPIYVTVAGIFNNPNIFEQFKNASLDIVIKFGGSVSELRPVPLQNAC